MVTGSSTSPIASPTRDFKIIVASSLAAGGYLFIRITNPEKTVQIAIQTRRRLHSSLLRQISSTPRVRRGTLRRWQAEATIEQQHSLSVFPSLLVIVSPVLRSTISK